MTRIENTPPDQLRLKYITNELQGMRKILDYLYDGEQGAFNAMFFIKSNYKEWDKIIMWLFKNQLKGKRMVEFFQNESPDGGGYHMGVTLILSRIKGQKNFEQTIKLDELL